MAENTASARKKLNGHRRAVREHVEKWQRYPDADDKAFARKTIERIQNEIRDLRQKHPTLDGEPEDTWRP